MVGYRLESMRCGGRSQAEPERKMLLFLSIWTQSQCWVLTGGRELGRAWQEGTGSAGRRDLGVGVEAAGAGDPGPWRGQVTRVGSGQERAVGHGSGVGVGACVRT